MADGLMTATSFVYLNGRWHSLSTAFKFKALILTGILYVKSVDSCEIFCILSLLLTKI